MSDLVIGNVVMQDIVVEDVRAEDEGDVDVWLTAKLSVWFELHGIPKPVTIISGCWLDTDNDHVSWCSDDEGVRVIATYLGSEHKHAIRALMPRAVEELGHSICAKIREEYRRRIWSSEYNESGKCAAK